ncbi:MAG: heme exporter protein CcmB [Ehrlichia sp.]
MTNSRLLISELKLSISRGGNILNTIILFILMISTALFTIKNTEIAKTLPTILWICGVSTMHMSMYNLFENDYVNGSLEQMLIQNCAAELIIFLKILSHWIYTGIPLSIISMFVDFVVLENNICPTTFWLGLSLGASLLVISFISAVGHALVLGESGGVVIAQILTLPIMIPVLVYFSLLFDNFRNSVYEENIIFLSLLVISLIPLSVIFILFAIKLAVEHD